MQTLTVSKPIAPAPVSTHKKLSSKSHTRRSSAKKALLSTSLDLYGASEDLDSGAGFLLEISRRRTKSRNPRMTKKERSLILKEALDFVEVDGQATRNLARAA